jgi:hypothetical protein
VAREEDEMKNRFYHQVCLLCAFIAVGVLSLGSFAQDRSRWGGYNNNANPWQGRLRGDDQKRFDDYYTKWIHNRERKDTGEIASMEIRMLDVYAHNGIPSNTPYDLVASPNVGIPMSGYDRWRGRLRGEDQKRFDSYYIRWLEYRGKNDKEQIASMEGRMLEVYDRNHVPLTTPYEFIASSNVVPNQPYNSGSGYPDGNYGGYPSGNLRIMQASYGAAGRQIDVSQRLQGMVTSDGLSLRVNNDSMGSDPAPNTRKQLYVVYGYQGQQRSITVDENNDLRIP